MGRESNCRCDWAGTQAEVKALIEPPDLILRGALRKRIPIEDLKRVRAEGGLLRFTADGDAVVLDLGDEKLAARWVEALLKAPPSLAKKLRITGETAVWMIGKADDAALEAALGEARKVSSRSGDLIVARVEEPDDLTAALVKAADALGRGVPLWFIYRKGRGHALSESVVRSTGLAAGIVDTKVASVSATLTALRFVKRKS